MSRTPLHEHVTIEWLHDTEWVYAPSQDRSRKGLQKILLAAKELFLANGYDETTITQISKKSGVSVGSIYHRFPDKQSILYAVLESYRRARFAQLAEMTREEFWRDKGPLEVLDFHIEIIFSSARNDPGITRMIERQRSVNPVIQDMQNDWNEHVCTVLTTLYQPHADLIARPDIGKAVRYVHNIIRGSALWVVVSAPPGNDFLKLEDEEYQQEAFLMAAGYLGLQPV
jgi:AcrR family transcriptional regulator